MQKYYINITQLFEQVYVVIPCNLFIRQVVKKRERA
jgi:hypothetical protein